VIASFLDGKRLGFSPVSKEPSGVEESGSTLSCLCLCKDTAVDGSRIVVFCWLIHVESQDKDEHVER
jgi:hypothetical protein